MSIFPVVVVHPGELIRRPKAVLPMLMFDICAVIQLEVGPVPPPMLIPVVTLSVLKLLS